MSFLITGMTMPTEGCKIIIAADGNVWVNAWPKRGYMRVKNAKAVPIPPHGDLIDRAELVKHDHQHYEYLSDEFYITVRDIENAPTIIPAEEGE